ncbi:MAG: DUF4304 domain-containing protein [Solirubrobacteraceae bacterium]
MRAQDAFDALTGETVWPFLRARGFTRTKGTFHRPVEDNWKVVNLQKSYTSDAGEVHFTINLSVGVGALRDGLYTWADGRRPAASVCHFRERIGTLAWGLDTWWTIGPETERAPLGRTLVDALEQHGLPWLAQHSTEAALLELTGDPERQAREDHINQQWPGCWLAAREKP